MVQTSSFKGWLAASAAAILALAVVGSLMFTGSAHAAANSVSVSPASQTVVPNGTATVNIVAEAPTGNLGAWDLRVAYDQTKLQLTSGLGDCSAVGSTCQENSPGVIRVGGIAVSQAGLPGTVTLASLSFKAIGASGSQVALDVTLDLFADGPGNSVTGTTVSDGTVTIQAATPTPSPTPSPTPCGTACTPTPSPTATPKKLPDTGGAASDGSSSVPWALGVLGLAVLAGGVWVTARTRGETL